MSNHRYKSADKFIVFMHYVRILIALSCQCVMFCCVILGCLETCCYRCGDTLISYDDTHTQLYRGGGVMEQALTQVNRLDCWSSRV